MIAVQGYSPTTLQSTEKRKKGKKRQYFFFVFNQWLEKQFVKDSQTSKDDQFLGVCRLINPRFCQQVKNSDTVKKSSFYEFTEIVPTDKHSGKHWEYKSWMVWVNQGD
jgi:hypothetical protein